MLPHLRIRHRPSAELKSTMQFRVVGQTARPQSAYLFANELRHIWLTLLQPIPAERELALGSLRRALAGLSGPADGSPGWPRHRQGRRSSPEARAAPRTRHFVHTVSILTHGVRAVESPVPVGRLVTPLRLVGPFGRSNGPCEGQRAVPMPVRLTRQSIRPGVQAGRRGRGVKRYETCVVRVQCSMYRMNFGIIHKRSFSSSPPARAVGPTRPQLLSPARHAGMFAVTV